MTREEKNEIVQDLTAVLGSKPNVYVTDGGGMTVAAVNNLRRECFKAGIEMRVVKNTLLRKAMEATGRDYSGVYPAMKMQSNVFFVGEEVTAPAKLIQKFRGAKGKLPVLKGAFIDEAIFLGDEELGSLATLKGKNELLGELIGLLQSPMQQVMGALQSGGNTIAGVLKTLEERG
jgi:large subunit ribosomal protein L10